MGILSTLLSLYFSLQLKISFSGISVNSNIQGTKYTIVFKNGQVEALPTADVIPLGGSVPWPKLAVSSSKLLFVVFTPLTKPYFPTVY